MKKINKTLITNWIIPLGLAIVISLLINKYIGYIISVPTGSMEDTIEKNDKLLVKRTKDIEYKRGDILVFKSNESNMLLVKRLIGLPGEKVEINKESVFIDGERLKEDYINHYGGKDGKFEVPKDEYLFLGDNRANSKDSRYWQDPYINRKDIIGIVVFKIFPFNSSGRIND